MVTDPTNKPTEPNPAPMTEDKEAPCEHCTSVAGGAAVSGPGKSSAGTMPPHSTPTHGDVPASEPKQKLDGGGHCKFSKETSPTRPGMPKSMVMWIVSQRASLAEISARLAPDTGSVGKRLAQPTQAASMRFDSSNRPGSSSKTRQGSEREGEIGSPQTWWRADTAGGTEKLPRLRLGHHTVATDGSCSRSDSTSRRQGRSQERANPHQFLPTLCATDYKSPYSEEGYRNQARKRSKPLRDTARHLLGIRLTPDFCEWWMGWPIGATAYAPWATPGYHCKQQQHGGPLEVHHEQELH
jgi:hypothetical protein